MLGESLKFSGMDSEWNSPLVLARSHNGVRMASLFVIQGRDQGRRFDLGSTPRTIGRDGSADITVRDHEVSRKHAEFRLEAGSTIVTDLKSSNGTWVNGRRVEQHELRTGDRVQIGRTMLLFTAGEEPSQSVEAVDIVRRGEILVRGLCIPSVTKRGANSFTPMPLLRVLGSRGRKAICR